MTPWIHPHERARLALVIQTGSGRAVRLQEGREVQLEDIS